MQCLVDDPRRCWEGRCILESFLSYLSSSAPLYPDRRVLLLVHTAFFHFLGSFHVLHKKAQEGEGYEESPGWRGSLGVPIEL